MKGRTGVLPTTGSGFRPSGPTVWAALTVVFWASGFMQWMPGPVRPILAIFGATAWVRFLIRCPRPGYGFQRAWMWGTVFYLFVLYWLPGTIVRHSRTPPMLAWLAIGLLAVYMGLYWGIWAFGTVIWRKRLYARVRTHSMRILLTAGVAALLGTGLLQIQAVGLTGFPWGWPGYLLTEWLPLVQWTDLWGAIALNGWLILIGGTVLGMDRKHFRTAGVAGIVLLGGPLLYAGWTLPMYRSLSRSARTIHVRIVQPSIPQTEKHDPATAWAWFRRQIRLSRRDPQTSLDLVIWPEASVPFQLAPRTPWWRLLRELQRANRTYLLLGADRWVSTDPPRGHNSAWLLGPRMHIIEYYDKGHLVPFGEYIPLRRWLPFVRRLVPGMIDLMPGAGPRPIQSPWGPLGVHICFESVFPELLRQLTHRGAVLLVTLTNDAWFGRSSGAFQHFLHTRLRAVENRRSLVFVANSGISGWIDPTGRVGVQTRLFTVRAVDVTVPLISEPRTVWTRYGRAFQWGYGAAAVFLLLGGGFFRQQTP